MCVCECKETNLQEVIMCNYRLHITDSFKLHQASLSYLLSFFFFPTFWLYFLYLYLFVCLLFILGSLHSENETKQ